MPPNLTYLINLPSSRLAALLETAQRLDINFDPRADLIALSGDHVLDGVFLGRDHDIFLPALRTYFESRNLAHKSPIAAWQDLSLHTASRLLAFVNHHVSWSTSYDPRPNDVDESAWDDLTAANPELLQVHDRPRPLPFIPLQGQPPVVTETVYTALFINHAKADDRDLMPVARLVNEEPGHIYLLAYADPTDPDTIFALADLNVSYPEAGYISLAAIREAARLTKTTLRLDPGFKPRRTLIEYADIGRQFRRITT